MKMLLGAIVVVVLACPLAYAEKPAEQEQKASRSVSVKHAELEKTLKIAEYYQQRGNIAAAQFYRGKADRIDAKRIYVKVKSDSASRRQAAQMQELIVKSIVQETPHVVVGTVENADMILEMELRPVSPTDR